MRLLEQSSDTLTNRRQFMQTLAVGGTAMGTVGCATSAQPSSEPVAIVGGGVAGLTAAYRLMKAGQPVHLYEAGTRLGGRMFTQNQFNQDGMFVELGGELVDTNHRDLFRLARELGVPMQDLRKGEHGHDVFWFDQKARSEAELLAAFRPLGERIAVDAEGLYDSADRFTDKARALDQISLANYLSDRGKGVEKWVIDLLIAAYEPEFGVDAARQSSLNLVDFINPDSSDGFEVFGDSDEAWRIRGGNGRLPEALHAAISERVEIRPGHPLSSIKMSDQAIGLSFAAKQGQRSETYQRVILAMPFTLLRRVDGIFGLPISSDKKRCIKEMGYGMNVKVFRGFNRRVWRDPRPGQPEANGSVFAQQPTFQNVWETSRGQSGERGIITNLLGGRRGETYSAAAMGGYLRQLDAVFPGIKAAFDGNGGAMNWPQMPWARGSYSCPLVGQYTWIYEVSPTPELDGRLLFAGEHTSTASPGFMNGGVESGNRAAREALNAA